MHKQQTCCGAAGFNCDQGRSCPVPYSCEVPEPERHSDTMNTFVIALWVAVSIFSLVCAVLPALFA